MNRHNPGNFPEADPSSGRAQDSDRGRQNTSARAGRQPAGGARAAAADGPVDERAARPTFALDPWSILRPASKRWYWLLFACVLGGIGGAVLGLSMWKTYYSATGQIVEYKPPVATDAYTPQQLVGPTLVGMVKSPEIMRAIAQKMASAGKQLAGNVDANPERQSQIVTVTANAIDPRSAIELANMYSNQVIEFTREYQRKEAEEADRYVTTELETTENNLRAAQKAVPAAPGGATLALLESGGATRAASPTRLAKQSQELEAAKDKLNELLVKYTDNHQSVKAQRSLIAELEARLQLKMDSATFPPAPVAAPAPPAPNPNATPSSGREATRDEWELAVYKVRQLDNYQSQLLARQRAIQVFKKNPPGNFTIMQPANPDTVGRHAPWVKVALLSAFFGLLGMVAAAGELLRRELFDTRLKTESDVARVTGLPVLANLGDIRQMSLATRETWAFRAWIALQDRLAYSPNHGLICGITSSNSGDGRSTWIALLAGAARKCGFRVLTIATKATADAPAMSEEVPDQPSEPTAESAATEANAVHAEAETVGARAGGRSQASGRATTREPTFTGGRDRKGDSNHSSIVPNPADPGGGADSFAGDSEFTSLTASALFTPAMVTEKLMGNETDPLVHIPLPGWTWNLERRKQWQGALNVWRKIDNVVILVELPPASMPESVLLASNLPNLLWLAEAGKSDASDTRAQLQTLRHARCNLVGAVINRAMAPVAGGRFSRWVGCLTMLGLLGLAGNGLVAAENIHPAVQTAAVAAPAGGGTAFSVVSPSQRAQWQQKLTLGPGDILNLGLFGDAELAREQVPVGPDGRVSYLEAENVQAAGLTVDEFRDKLNEELSKYRRAPQAVVVPVSYKSKKYFVLGKVAQRGAFPLDRPMTLLEAVARAGGMETGLAADRSLIELADLSRSFIARNGQRLPVDFEKLFAQGDFSQNITLEPNDYIYFPASGEKEVYVLGAVRFPGSYVYNTSTGALGAIAARGGFSERAWQKKLIVIRGGLGHPQTFALDGNMVLSAQIADLKLQPKDIVFVSERPWIRAEELLDAAANAFVTSAVVTWTGENVTRSRR